MKLTLTLPLPGPACSPNSRTHWRSKARAVKTLRSAARIVAMDAVNRMGRPFNPLKTATVRATFYHPTIRRRDKDNLLSSLKGAFDGLQDGGLIADDNGLTHLPIELRKGCDLASGAGYVVLEVES
jgi:Holliday junction resolvase RusA-like endonuclease